MYCACGTFGDGRRAHFASRPPYVQQNAEGFYEPMFWADYTLRLTPNSPPRQKYAKMALAGAVAVGCSVAAVVLLLAGSIAGHVWAAGWEPWQRPYATELHIMALAVLYALAARRGYRGAYRPVAGAGALLQIHLVFAALDAYLQRQRALGDSTQQDPVLFTDRPTGEHPACLLTLPDGTDVVVRLGDEGVPLWFRMQLPDGPQTFRAINPVRAGVDATAMAVLRRNGLL